MTSLAAQAATRIRLVPGTAVLLSAASGGTGGQSTSSTTSRTNIFAPAAYVDYKRIGGEPFVAVDRYPFPGSRTDPAAQCAPATTTPCYRDLTYASAPNGFVFPHYSPFWKSDDMGKTFRVPAHVPSYAKTFGQGGGGGDSHIAIGQLTHRVFFVDLPGPGCVTMNISDDFGETWESNQVACGTSPGTIDDRQWVAADENPAPAASNVYVSFINFTNILAPQLTVQKSTDDGETFGGVCTLASVPPAPAPLPAPAPDNAPTSCPDPADFRLQVAGPIVVDRAHEGHPLYIPFIRGGSGPTSQVTPTPPWDLYVARSLDQGTTWTRHLVAHLGNHNPVNLFPQLSVDRAGNLYFVWSQTQGPGENAAGLLGEQDVYYSYSTNGGSAWAPPINITPSRGKSAIMPWSVAGDAGLIDVVY
ncbi:MAG TPA: sialidase family protein, partial [Actinomycetota bacterium]